MSRSSSRTKAIISKLSEKVPEFSAADTGDIIAQVDTGVPEMGSGQWPEPSSNLEDTPRQQQVHDYDETLAARQYAEERARRQLGNRSDIDPNSPYAARHAERMARFNGAHYGAVKGGGGEVIDGNRLSQQRNERTFRAHGFGPSDDDTGYTAPPAMLDW